MASRAEALDADGPGYAGRYGAPMTITNGFADPELASLVRDHYTDPPFVGMPRWLIRRVLAACADSPFFTLLILRVQGEFAGLMLALLMDKDRL